MLKIKVAGVEMFNEETLEFVTIPSQTLVLEYSLLSVYKWEAKHKRIFLSRSNKTVSDTLSFIQCMTINDVDERIYACLTDKHLAEIQAYIDEPMSAATFNDISSSNNTSGELTSADVIYYWMVSFNIPFTCEKWHLNRLLTLVKTCSVKNQPKQKMNAANVGKQNSSLNADRKKRLKSKG